MMGAGFGREKGFEAPYGSSTLKSGDAPRCVQQRLLWTT
jgi:hypothetical protein